MAKYEMIIYKRFGQIAKAYGLSMVQFENEDNTSDITLSGYGVGVTYVVPSEPEQQGVPNPVMQYFYVNGKRHSMAKFFQALEQFRITVGLELSMPVPTDVA